MIILSNGDQLRVNRLTGSAGIDIIVNYRRTSNSVFEPKRAFSSVGGSNAVILSNSESGITYLVESIYIRSYASLSSINIVYEVSATPVCTLITASLTRGDSLHYDHKRGFKKLNQSGLISYAQTSSVNELRLLDMEKDIASADALNNNPTPNTLQLADGGNLWIAVPTGKYYFRAVFHYTSAATATGSRHVPHLGSYFASGMYTLKQSLASTTRSVYTGLNGDNLPSTCSATSASTGSNIAIIEGFIESNDAPAALYFKFASEVASSLITSKAKSYFMIIPVA